MTTPPLQTRSLRILATSDIHMRLLADDAAAPPGSPPPSSLARLLPLIATARAEALAETPPRACVLLDNGDLLQGSALGDLLGSGQIAVADHPAAALLEEAQYDAMGLGNHDLDYGLSYLESVARALPCPLLCANMTAKQPLSWLQSSVILDRGGLRLGIMALLPHAAARLSAEFDSFGLQAEDILNTARTEASRLRAQGCDLIIALAHTGFPNTGDAEPDNLLGDLAAAGCVDALIGGHSHHQFPNPDLADYPGADVDMGSLHGVPTVMPGFAAARLGQIDLTCAQGPDGRWKVRHARSTTRAPASNSSDAAQAHIRLRPAYTEAANILDSEIGQTNAPLHSYFAGLCPGHDIDLLARAQAVAIDQARAGTDLADLPLLSAAATAKSGGRGGAYYFTDIPPGPLRLRHLGELQPYPNHVWASVLNGAEIRNWLERAAAVFSQLDGDPTTPLRNPEMAIFEFDTLFGLTYQIDATAPPLYSARGRPISKGRGRIHDIRFDGTPIEDSQRFLVASSNYRLSGGGNCPGLAAEKIALRPNMPIRTALQNLLRAGDCAPAFAQPWRFADTMRGIATHFVTGPGANAHLPDIAHLQHGPTAQTSEGLLSIPLRF